MAAAREARPRCVRPKGRGQDLTRYGERALDTRGGGERGEHAGPRRATENPSSAAAVELESWGASAGTPSRAFRSRRKAKLNQLEAEVEQLRALVPTADAQAIAPRPVAPQRESFEDDAAYRRARYSHQTHCIEWLESERARLREALAHQQGVSTGLLSVVRGPVDDD